MSFVPPDRARLLVLTDRADQSGDLVALLALAGSVEPVALQNLPHAWGEPPALVICDIDLGSSRSTRLVRNELQRHSYQSIRRIFVVEQGRYHDAFQATDLGAHDLLVRPFKTEAVLAQIRGLFASDFAKEIQGCDAKLRGGLAGANAVLSKIFEGLPAGNPLTLADIVQEELRILQAVSSARLDGWLDMVWRHHAQSYRHCFSVTGFAVAFAQALGMREADQRRLARAALVHDVGKAFIPLAILDKPGRLSDPEMEAMRRHSRIGFEALARQGGFPNETMQVVLHHHEMLDGSGYPCGLSGDAIPDLVRMITITDIFSALIEARPYKNPVSRAEAFEIMQGMVGKLDPDLLAAFRPVALGA